MKQFLSERPARFFEEISAIPRASGKEEKIADYLVAFAKDHGLACYRDAANNVLIKKSGSAGREGEKPLLMQAHTDMVTEVAFGFDHDFDKQGVTLVQEGNVLSAKGTTLGADDGFGVALMLSVLEDDSLSCPPVECLFTATEETGLVGAGQFDYDLVSARRMLNFDSAEEHLVITGCCGGIRSDIHMPVTLQATEGKGLRVGVHGLAGGHSGEDIHRGRANALCVLGAVLTELKKHTDFRLASIVGGDKDNAIPRDCDAVILPVDVNAAKAVLADSEALLSLHVTAPEDGARSLCVEEVAVDGVMSAADTLNALAVLGVPNGVLHPRKDNAALPETSRNLASVRTNESELKFTLSSRSPFEWRIDESVAELEALAAKVGGTASHRSRYPGWEGAPDSPVSTLWQRAYRETTGREIDTTVIHAGLECGLISSKLEGLDVISVGCNIYDLHTPAERMELDSFERVYRTLLAFLKEC